MAGRRCDADTAMRVLERTAEATAGPSTRWRTPSSRTPAAPSAPIGAARDATDPTDDVPEGTRRMWRMGRTSWAILGVLLLVAVVGWVLSLVPLVVVPLVLALFPATLLVPVAGWLRRIGAPSRWRPSARSCSGCC
jgi:hypothetical protein